MSKEKYSTSSRWLYASEVAFKCVSEEHTDECVSVSVRPTLSLRVPAMYFIDGWVFEYAE